MAPHPTPMLTTGQTARKTPPHRFTAGWGCPSATCSAFFAVLAVVPDGEIGRLQNFRTWPTIRESLGSIGVANDRELVEFGKGVRASAGGGLVPCNGSSSFGSVLTGGGGLLFSADRTKGLGCFVFHNAGRIILTFGYARKIS